MYQGHHQFVYVIRYLNIESDISFMTASVVWWSDFLAADTEVLGSMPGSARFSE
jgi:hypothetical protein